MAPARTWDVLVDAGCSSDEPLGAISSVQKKRENSNVEYGMGVGVLLYLRQDKRSYKPDKYGVWAERSVWKAEVKAAAWS